MAAASPAGAAFRHRTDDLGLQRETLRELALRGAGIVQLADFMTRRDREAGRLVPLLVRETLDVRQPINAVYYHDAQLAARLTCFLDYVSARLEGETPEAAEGL